MKIPVDFLYFLCGLFFLLTSAIRQETKTFFRLFSVFSNKLYNFYTTFRTWVVTRPGLKNLNPIELCSKLIPGTFRHGLAVPRRHHRNHDGSLLDRVRLQEGESLLQKPPEVCRIRPEIARPEHGTDPDQHRVAREARRGHQDVARVEGRKLPRLWLDLFFVSKDKPRLN